MFVVCDKSVRCTTRCMQSTPLYQKSHKKLYISSSRGTTMRLFSSVILFSLCRFSDIPKENLQTFLIKNDIYMDKGISRKIFEYLRPGPTPFITTTIVSRRLQLIVKSVAIKNSNIGKKFVRPWIIL